MKKYDMHTHTFYSDGILSPQKLVDMAVKYNLQGIAITDHDAIEGIEEGIAQSRKYKDFIIIPGIEFGTVYDDEEVHILGYFIDYKNNELINITNKLKSERITRGIKMVNKLNELGLKIDLNDVKKHSGEDYIGRPHVGRALIDKGYVKSLDEAFEKYLDRGMPAYVERFQLNVEETITLINNVGGISILAHPGLLKKRAIVQYVISKGINGIECMHSKHTEDDTNYFTQIAKENDLIITAGSDYHGELINKKMPLGDYFIDINEISEMRRRINNV